MQKIRQIIEELKELKTEANHRAALRVYALLDNNRKLFLEKMDPDDFNYLLRSFEEITNSPAKDYGSAGYKSEYTRHFELLLFHLNKIV